VNPETGERDIFYRSEYGKKVEQFSDEPQPPNPK
jgi:hypothetical protein